MKKFTVILAVFAFACGDEDDYKNGYPCTDEIIFGLKVSIKDAVTGEYVSEGVTVTAVSTDGIAEELDTFTSASSVFYGAAETEGTYTITVSKEGYADYTSEPVTVEADRCHVTTEEMTIAFRPLEQA